MLSPWHDEHGVAGPHLTLSAQRNIHASLKIDLTGL